MPGADATSDRADPLALMPADIPEGKKRRWRKLSDRAKAGHYRAAVELKCIDCCGWSRAEAATCSITDCPLWPLNRRIFGGRRT